MLVSGLTVLLKSLKVVTFWELITINQESLRRSIDLDWNPVPGSLDLLTVDMVEGGTEEVVVGGCREGDRRWWRILRGWEAVLSSLGEQLPTTSRPARTRCRVWWSVKWILTPQSGVTHTSPQSLLLGLTRSVVRSFISSYPLKLVWLPCRADCLINFTRINILRKWTFSELRTNSVSGQTLDLEENYFTNSFISL